MNTRGLHPEVGTNSPWPHPALTEPPAAALSVSYFSGAPRWCQNAYDEIVDTHHAGGSIAGRLIASDRPDD